MRTLYGSQDGRRFKVPVWNLEARPEHQVSASCFRQEGVAMLSSVLCSLRAVQVNIAIMRVFVRLRETLALHQELAHKLAELERRIEGHDIGVRTMFDLLSRAPAQPLLLN